MKLLGTVLRKVIGTRNERELKRIGSLVEGVNRFLLGPGDIFGDFWPGDFNESHPDGTTHSVTSATPAPGTLALLGLAWLMGTRRRRR